MSRSLSIFATLVFLLLSLVALVGLGSWMTQPSASPEAAITETAGPQDFCGAGAAASPMAGFWLIDNLTNGGTYMPRTHCMVNEAGTTDWPWVWALIGLAGIVIAGYLKIFVFWRRAYMDEQPKDRNKKLMDLAWIFLWCAVCGYATSVLMFVWPAYRLVALCLVPLAFFTWRFAANLEGFRVSLSAKRLQRELEESLRARTTELEAAVEERTRELDEARRSAEKANAAKGAFVANMSHEIRTPMTAILGFADLLDDPDADEASRGEMLDRIRASGRHLLTVINDVLDVSKIESGKMQVDPVECPAHRVIAESVALFETAAHERGISLELDIQGPFPERVYTDPTRLRQVVMNLVSNAIKFTPDGGVIVRARVDSLGNRGTLVVEITDTGIGMTPEQIGRLFNPFEQAEATTLRKYGGTGLGLAISRTLARLLGGDISIVSALGAGSTFSLSIDAGPIARVRLLDNPMKDNRRCGSRIETSDLPCEGRVLVVDDGADNRRLLTFYLERAGAEVIAACDGFEALRAIEDADEPIQLVLMDLQMPRMDGYEAVKRIKQKHPSLPVVAVTAHAMDETRDACLRGGFDDVATKPVEPRRLLGMCRAWLDDPDRAAA